MNSADSAYWDEDARRVTALLSPRARHREMRREAELAGLIARHLPASGRFLDAGTGSGRLLVRMCDLGADCVGIDVSQERIDQARALLRDCGVEADTRVASVLGLPFPDQSFDVVTSSEVLEHLEDPLGAMRELVRVTRPGGSVVISVPFAEDLFYEVCPCCGAQVYRHGHVQSFDPAKLSLLLEDCGAGVVTLRGLGCGLSLRGPLERLASALPQRAWRLLDAFGRTRLRPEWLVAVGRVG